MYPLSNLSVVLFSAFILPAFALFCKGKLNNVYGPVSNPMVIQGVPEPP